MSLNSAAGDSSCLRPDHMATVQPEGLPRFEVDLTESGRDSA